MIILSYNKNDARLAIDNVRQGHPSCLIGPILWGHSGLLCHALSLSLLLSSSSSLWTSMRRRRATVATPDEWQCGVRRLAVANVPNKCFKFNIPPESSDIVNFEDMQQCTVYGIRCSFGRGLTYITDSLDNTLLPRDAMLARCMPSSYVCLSVTLWYCK